MVKFEGIEREHVLAAIQECVDTGKSEFLKKYGYGQAIRYVLLEDNFEKGGRYASKAILGVARKYARPELGACAVENFHGTVPHLTLFSMGKYGTIRHNFSTIGKILDLIFHHGQSKTSYRASS